MAKEATLASTHTKHQQQQSSSSDSSLAGGLAFCNKEYQFSQNEVD